ncbi:MAG: hypothetical protein KAX04_04890, partial [Methanomicrobia archaeon]|nr:hypothetical protein [Methanomicrobia archaeon]
MKKMKGLIIVVVVLVSLVAVISAYRVKEFSICTDTNHQCDPAIYRNIVVWTDFRTAVDLYGYDLSTSTEFQITTDTNDQSDPAIYENIVVWEDDRNDPGNTYDIYGAVLEEEAAVTANPIAAFIPLKN